MEMTTYTPLHSAPAGEHEVSGDDNTPTPAQHLSPHTDTYDENDAEDIDDDDDFDHIHHKHAFKKELQESFDFNDTESLMWRKV